MEMQTNPGYSVDNRYHGVERSVDNLSGRRQAKRAATRYIALQKVVRGETGTDKN